MPARKDLDTKALRDAFLAEFGEEAAANTETGRLLGFQQAKKDRPPETQPED